MGTRHCVLLGDSIFDNGRYTDGGPAVIDHLRGRLGAGWAATLGAVDGSTTADVPGQLARLPAGATHLVVSAGGNDAILASGMLDQPAKSVADALSQLALMGLAFESGYQKMLRALAGAGLPVVVCTVYAPNFDDHAYQVTAVAGLTLFNDVIIRAAIGAGLPLIDLRQVCTSPGDFANEIEPSAAGGAKIAAAIAHAVAGHDFTSGRTVVYA